MSQLTLTGAQQRAYDRYIKIRNRVGMVRVKGEYHGWVRHADVSETIDVAGYNHPFYSENELWVEYKEAFSAWLAVEPSFRDEERMRSSRGDYGQSDNWEERKPKVRDIYSTIKEEVQ